MYCNPNLRRKKIPNAQGNEDKIIIYLNNLGKITINGSVKITTIVLF
jgi:hypothetical protein